MRSVLVYLLVGALRGPCKFKVNAPDDQHKSGSPVAGNLSAPAVVAAPDALAARDLREGQALPAAAADDVPRPVMQAQVVLDRLAFTPGVVDGREGASTANALRGFQEANGLQVTGKLDDATRQALARWNNIPATRLVTIPADSAAGP